MQTAEYLYMSDPAATILAAIIGAIASFIAAFLGFVLPERKKRPGLIAAFLDTISKNVKQMITMFEKKEIPHQAGHELFSNIAFFEEATNQKFLSKMALETLDELRKLAQEAETVDLYLYKDDENADTLRGEWIRKAKGIVGELRSEAAKLRAS